MKPMNPACHEDLAQFLEANGRYRVLRRVPRLPPMPALSPGIQTGIFVNVETTGLDPAQDEIIALAMVEFAYDDQGQIRGVGDSFIRLRQPAVDIPARVTELTGITAEAVAGTSIDPAEVEKFVVFTFLIFAHDAAFNRKFLERFCPVLKNSLWACSMSQVPWGGKGHAATKLETLLMDVGLFYDSHRAGEGC